MRRILVQRGLSIGNGSIQTTVSEPVSLFSEKLSNPMKLTNNRKSAFTLIELLIVVAIIAILAAIAVPNFLEAQTRAKISRVKSDIRAIVTAMESYRVDMNLYPTPSDKNAAYIPAPKTATDMNPFETRVPVLLTTPVAYMTTRPEDPFAVTRIGESKIYHVYVMEYIQLRMDFGPLTNWRVAFNNFYEELTGHLPPSTIEYVLDSWGPDQDHDIEVPHVAPTGPHAHGEAAAYDPTNGTVSSGDILYFGSGMGFLFN